MRVDIGPRRLVCISDEDEINTMLRDRPEGFRRWSDQQSVFQEMGINSVFTAEGEDWKRQRRLVVTALNTNHLHRYFDVVRTSTERLHRRLAEATQHGQPFDIAHELTSYTVDITSALAFGHDLNTLERRDNELQRHIQRVFQAVARRLAAPVPYWRWVRLPADRASDRSLLELRRAVAGFIEQARERMRRRPELRESPENFLEGMLAAQEIDGTFTDDEIIGNTLVILIAGEDTTAYTLAWTIWFLASRRDIQARLAQEADEILDEHPFPVDYETVGRLHYGEAVLRESMRLKTVGPLMTAEPLMDSTICNTHIPAGTRLVLLLRHAHHGPAGDFDPQRWLEGGDDSARAPKSLAFGAGPRFCPGRNLAFLESKTVLAMLARNFQIELDNSDGLVEERFGFTMIPKGLRIRLRDRTSTAPTTSPCSQRRLGASTLDRSDT